MDSFGEIAEAKQLKDRVLHAIYYGGLKANDFSGMGIHKDREVMNVDPIEVQCPENVIRKEEELMDLETQNKSYF